MKNKRKLVALLVSLVCLVSFTLTSYARESIKPYWSNLVSISCSFDIDYDGKAMIEVIISADYTNTDKVNSTCKLQRLESSGWKTVKTWNITGTEGQSDLAYDKNYYVASDYSYRVEITAKAYNNGSLKETVTEHFDYGWFSNN